jgi:ABC-2 type transport system ATP-binding protein
VNRDVPVELDGLSKAFGQTHALDGVSLTIERGEVFGYLGPNGAGKTTTIRLLVGLLRPTAGAARVYGHDVWRETVAVHRRVGYVPGDPSLYRRLTGREHVAYLERLRGVPSSAVALALAERLELDLDRPAGQLSRGNRQKLAVVLAWMSGPDLLVLDEPTSGLDPLVQQEFVAMLREHTAGGGSVLLSSHVLAEVQRVADRVGVLRAGRLIAVDEVQELLKTSLHRVRATFADAVTVDEFAGIPGLSGLQVQDHTLTCSAPQQALDVLLKRVSAHVVADFECAETELEETFLAYYGKGDVDAAERL